MKAKRSVKTKPVKRAESKVHIFFILLLVVIIGLILYAYHQKKTYERIQVIHKVEQKKLAKIRPVIPTPQVPINRIIKLPIVMFHYVETVQDPRDITRVKLATNPFLFETQLKLLKENNYQSYFARDIPRLLQSNPAPDKSVILTFDDGYEDFYTNAFPLLKKYNFKATIYIIYDFIGKPQFLNEKEIQEMIDSGIVEIGSHTLDHKDLRSISTQEATMEIIKSKSELEKKFHIKVSTFAYPGGGLNDEVEKIVKAASYEAALSTKPGVKYSQEDIFTLPRIRPGYLILDEIKNYFSQFTL